MNAPLYYTKLTILLIITPEKDLKTFTGENALPKDMVPHLEQTNDHQDFANSGGPEGGGLT